MWYLSIKRNIGGRNRQVDLLAQQSTHKEGGGGLLGCTPQPAFECSDPYNFKRKYKIRDHKRLPNSSFVHIVRDVLVFFVISLGCCKTKKDYDSQSLSFSQRFKNPNIA